MAPMITDSYLKYSNPDFGAKNQGYNQVQSGGAYYTSASKPAQSMPSMSYEQANADNSLSNFKLDSLQMSILDSTRRRYTAEENILEILRGVNVKTQTDLFDELIARVQANTEANPINIRRLDEFLDAVGALLTNTGSNECQKSCLRFLQVYFKSIEKLKHKKAHNDMLGSIFDEIDASLNAVLMPYLITLSVSSKLQLKQLSIDLMYTYMRLTDDLSALFAKFVKHGIENSDYGISKAFMDPTLCIVLTDEFRTRDFFPLVKSLTRQLSNSIFEASAIKCLNKIEGIVKADMFNAYLSKLPQNLREIYYSFKGNGKKSNNNNIINLNLDELGEDKQNMKFNLISQQIMMKLSGEDEIQRLQAIKQLEVNVKNIGDIRVVHPYYNEFISYMNNFVDDANYEVRLCSLKILCIFIQKLGTNVNSCYKVVCACARQVMSQTHQSKPIKQSLNTMLLLTIESMKSPILILECLLEKIKDRSAKAREEFLNIITGAVLKYPSDKFEPLRKVFYQVALLLCDIKRNVRHAALECIAVIYSKLKQVVSRV